MNKIFAIIIFAFILLLVFVSVDKYYHKWIQSHQQYYCYDSWRNGDKVTSMIYLKTRSKQEDYIKYYQEVEKGNNPYFPYEIPLKGISPNEPVYVIKFSGDSLLVKIAAYNHHFAGMGTGFLTCWVYSHSLHDIANFQDRLTPLRNTISN